MWILAKHRKTEATGTFLTNFGDGCHIKHHVFFGHFCYYWVSEIRNQEAKNAQKTHSEMGVFVVDFQAKTP